MLKKNKYKKYGGSNIIKIPRRSRHRFRQALEDGTSGDNLADSVLGFRLSSSLSRLSRPRKANKDEYEYPESEHEHNDHFEENNSSGGVSSDEINDIIYAFVIRHNLTKAATQDLLTLIRMINPDLIGIASSIYALRKRLQTRKWNTEMHYLCSGCKTYIGTSCDSKTCKNCDAETNSKFLQETDSYFYQFNIREILRSILESAKVAENLYQNLVKRNENGRHEVLRDICDGLLYQGMHIQSFNFTCSVNTDGVSSFKSSTFNFYPILVSINELSYSVRRSNTFIAALWFGQGKPNFEAFLKPFVKQCNDLSLEPIEWNREDEKMQSLVYFTIFVADSVARCSVQGMHQFNGQYGCPWCLLRGESIWLDEERRSRKWVFKFNEAPLRTPENFVEQLKQLQDLLSVGNSKETSFMGIKSASQLLLLKYFNIVNGFVYDIMHSAFLGVVKMLTSFWFDSCNHDRPFYIGKSIQNVDKVLKLCRVPFDYDRAIRAMTQRKVWKASEWRTWTFVSSTVLKGILPEVYRHHLNKLSNSLMIMSDELISMEDLVYCENTLRDFVQQTQDIYGIDACSFNLHILLHASTCVKNWGPLWCYSAFQYENYNGILKNLCHGSKKIITQMKSRTEELLELQRRGRKQFKDKGALEFFQSLMFSKQFVQKFKKITNVIFLGPCQEYLFTLEEQKKLNDMGFDSSVGESYKKCLIHGKLYNRSDQCTSQRNNSIVVTLDGKLWILQKLICVLSSNQDGVAQVSRIHGQASAVNSYLTNVTNIEDEWVLIKLSSIIRQKFIIIYESGNIVRIKYLVRLPNTYELE